MIVTSEPAFAVPVSKNEKEKALKIRKRFEDVHKAIIDFEKTLIVFFDNANNLEKTTDLSTLGPLLVRYKHKIKERFKDIMDTLQKAVTNFDTGFVDTKLDNIRDLIIESAKSMRKKVIELVKIFKGISEPEFLERAKGVHEQILQASRQMLLSITDELFAHIDLNILGKLKLGLFDIPLVIRGNKHGI